MYDDSEKISIPLVSKMFNKVHEFQEIDHFLDKGKEYFSKKYNIDYFSVHMMHHNRSSLIGFYAHDQWNEWLYSNNRGANHKDEFFVKMVPLIKKNEIYMEYFHTYVNRGRMDMRAEIVGVRKYGGCTVLVSDELNNITIYDLTFKDDSAFGTLDKKVLYDLTKDLIRYKSLLLPFINHVDQMGDFSDKLTLHKSMDKFIKDNSSLFHF